MPRSHWRREIRGFRGDVDQELRDSPSLRQHFGEMYRAAWRRAADDFARDVNEESNTRRVLARLGLWQETPRYDLDREQLDPDWFPADP